MKILLSAYACEPNRGSEAAVGWNWLVELAAKGHEVWVLTRSNNKHAIEEGLEYISEKHLIHFVYFDLPAWFRFWKRGAQGVQLYYLLWQIGIYFVAKKLMKTLTFDVIHHVTFVSVRFPSFLAYLEVPFIWGPLSGGEHAPWSLRRSFPLKGKIWDFARDVCNFYVRFDPFLHPCFERAQAIYVTSEDTKKLIPVVYHHKVTVQLAIGINLPVKNIPKNNEAKTISDDVFRILYVGNLLYLKGIHLAIQAFSSFHSQYPESCFTIIGKGPEKEWLQRLAETHKIAHAIEFLPHIPQQELLETYPLYDVFLFPSLHDSGGMVILEAMANGLPVICLDLGGPGIIVDNTCGLVINTRGFNELDVVQNMTEALVQLASNPDLCKSLSKQARESVEKFQWSQLVTQIYQART